MEHLKRKSSSTLKFKRKIQGCGEDLWAQDQNEGGPPCETSCERYAEGVHVYQRCTDLGGPGACSPRKIFKIKDDRIAVVAICASKYNFYVIETRQSLYTRITI